MGVCFIRGTLPLLVILSAGLQGQVVADFSATPLSGTLPLLVQFSDQSTVGVQATWLWDFGDGGTSNAVNPSHTYLTPGPYTVKLSVFSLLGGSDVESKPGYITVNPTPLMADFSAVHTSGRAPLKVSFSDETVGTTPTGLQWDFGDGTGSGLQKPSHTYNASGSFTVSLTAFVFGQSDTVSKVGFVSVQPADLLPDFSIAHIVGATPYTVSFLDQTKGAPPTSWKWKFGDGFKSTSQNPTHIYGLPGDYTVQLKVSFYGDSATIIKPAAVQLTPVELHPNFEVLPELGVNPLQVSFVNTSTGGPATQWIWDFGDDSFPSYLETPAPHTYTSPGLYTVSLTMTLNQQSVSEVKQGLILVERAEFLPDFDVLNGSGTNPLTVTLVDTTTGAAPDQWSWSLGGGHGLGESSSVSTLLTTPGTYDVTLQVSVGSQSQAITKQGVINVAPAVFSTDFSADTTAGPMALSVQFQDTTAGAAPTAWLWDFGDQTSSTQQNPLHTYTTPGTYTVTLTAFVGQQQQPLSKTGLIVVVPATLQPAFSATPTSGVNPVEVAFVDTSNGATPTGWSWQFGDGALSNEQHPAHLYTAPGSYSVSLTTSIGASSATSTQNDLIVVSPAFVSVDFGVEPAAGNAPLSVAFNSQSSGAEPTGWLWEFGDGFRSRDRAPRHTYVLPGLYPVSLTALVAEQSFTLLKDALISVGPFGGVFSQVARLPSSTVFVQTFDISLAATEGTALLGDPNGNALGYQTGSAAMFERRPGGGWVETASLQPAAAGAGDYLGWAVALEGDRAVVGAPFVDVLGVSEGVAHVFERSSGGAWVETATLSSRSPVAWDRFGVAVAVSGDRIAVGANFDDEAGTDVGAAHVFDLKADGSWIEAAQLLPSLPVSGSEFGAALALHGDLLVIGARFDPSGPGTGLVFVFERLSSGAWVETAVLTPGHPQSGDLFGESLALDGDTLLVGAPGLETPKLSDGGVYVFDKQPDGSWLQTALLLSTEGPQQAHFGWAVALSGDRALIGSDLADPYPLAGSLNQGAVTVLDRQSDGTWNALAELSSGAGVATYRFGQVVAFSGETILVGEGRVLQPAVSVVGEVLAFEDVSDGEGALADATVVPGSTLRWSEPQPSSVDGAMKAQLVGLEPRAVVVLTLAGSDQFVPVGPVAGGPGLGNAGGTVAWVLTADDSGAVTVEWQAPLLRGAGPACLQAQLWRDGMLLLSPILALAEKPASHHAVRD